MNQQNRTSTMQSDNVAYDFRDAKDITWMTYLIAQLISNLTIYALEKGYSKEWASVTAIEQAQMTIKMYTQYNIENK